MQHNWWTKEGAEKQTTVVSAVKASSFPMSYMCSQLKQKVNRGDNYGQPSPGTNLQNIKKKKKKSIQIEIIVPLTSVGPTLSPLVNLSQVCSARNTEGRERMQCPGNGTGSSAICISYHLPA